MGFYVKLGGQARGLNDAPLAVCRPLRKCFENSVESLSTVGLKFKASSSDACLLFRDSEIGEGCRSHPHAYG